MNEYESRAKDDREQLSSSLASGGTLERLANLANQVYVATVASNPKTMAPIRPTVLEMTRLTPSLAQPPLYAPAPFYCRSSGTRQSERGTQAIRKRWRAEAGTLGFLTRESEYDHISYKQIRRLLGFSIFLLLLTQIVKAC